MRAPRSRADKPLPLEGERLEHFLKWLRDHGAEPHDGSTVYEVVRVAITQGTLILYQNNGHKRKWSASMGPSVLKLVRTAYNMRERKGFENAHYGVISKHDKVKRLSRSKAERKRILQGLLDQQNSECFFCGVELKIKTKYKNDPVPSIEHLISVATGGPDIEANMVASCLKCNNHVGHMTVLEKIEYRDSFFE